VKGFCEAHHPWIVVGEGKGTASDAVFANDVLDVEKSHSFLLDNYKEGLAEWKKEQEKHALTKKRNK